MIAGLSSLLGADVPSPVGCLEFDPLFVKAIKHPSIFLVRTSQVFLIKKVRLKPSKPLGKVLV